MRRSQSETLLSVEAETSLRPVRDQVSEQTGCTCAWMILAMPLKNKAKNIMMFSDTQ